MDYAKTVVLGHVGDEPRIKVFEGGDQKAWFSVAVNSAYKDRKSGEIQKHTEWYQCVVVGKLVDVVREHVGKGTSVLLEAVKHTAKFKGRDGEEHAVSQFFVSALRVQRPTQKPAPGDAQSAQDAPETRDAPAVEIDDSLDELDELFNP